MPRSLRVALLVGALLSYCFVTRSHSGQASHSNPAPVAPPAQPAATRGPEGSASPSPGKAARQALHAELAERVVQVRKEVAALQARHDATTDAALRRALQQRIEAAKREQRLDAFRIQLRYAHAAGQLETVKELEALIETQMKAPVAPLLPLVPPAAPAGAVRPARPARAIKGGGQ